MHPAELRIAAEEIFRSGLAAADPYSLLKNHSRCEADRWVYESEAAFLSWPIPPKGSAGRILVSGAGKAVAPLARALEESLADRLDSGRLIVKYGHGLPLSRIRVEEAGHPLPDRKGVEATRRLLDDLSGLRSRDRVFVVLTGGGSALLVAPAEGVSLEDKMEATRCLLLAGATIQEINAVRKHISAVKGGRLLARLAPARALTLVVSDVVGDDLSSIASGPTVPDPTTFSDCLGILERYRLIDKIPASIRRRLLSGAQKKLAETPKPGDSLFQNARSLLLASNRQSVDAAAVRASGLGFEVEIFGYDMTGSTHDRARAFATRLIELQSAAQGARVALVAGGETTLVVKGTGRGGRNQEFALIAAEEISGRNGFLVLAAGTDGTDGPTDAAGAFADGGSLDQARSQGIDPKAVLENNDSYALFEALGDLLRTGPTGTNVMDLVIGLAG